MKHKTDNIWIGQKDLVQDQEFLSTVDSEFNSDSSTLADATSSLSGNRRDFLKFLGFGLGAATIAAGCDIPVKKAIPYVIKPDEIVPGIANYYASSFVNGGDYCSILVKTREGRPIKIEGNALSPVTKGGTSARAQASVLSLYDTNRIKGPQVRDGARWKDTTWQEIDKMMVPTLSSNGIRIISHTNMSPTSKKAIAEFVAKYPNTKVVTYDPVSASALLDANQLNFGVRAVPSYHFDKASVIVSFNADFLGTWISPIEYAADFAKGRAINDVTKASMSRLIQVESHMSLTGSNADNRILVRPSEQGVAIAHLYNEIVGGGPSSDGLNDKAKKAISKVASELKAKQGSSLVVSASNNVSEQLMINAINNALGNYGTTLDISMPSYQRQGNDTDLKAFVDDVKSGSVDLLLVYGANPVYDTVYGKELGDTISKIKNKVSFATVMDETSALCDVIVPTHHYLESWGDVEVKKGQYSLIQPTISPLFNSRQAEESLLKWCGSSTVDMMSEQPYYEYLKDNWKNTMFGGQNGYATFQGFWDSALHDGIYSQNSASSVAYTSAPLSGGITKPSKSEIEISFFETVHLANGQYAGNPWLMEMPDPVARTSWDNYLAVPVSFDGFRNMVGFNDLVDGDVVEIQVGEKSMKVPVIQQFGQMPGTVSLALGYGRTEAGNTGSNVGQNVNDCITKGENGPQLYNTAVTVSGKVDKTKEFACVQYHHTIGVKGVDNKTGEVINADEAALVYFDYFTGATGFQGALTDRSVIYTSNVKDVAENAESLKHKREHAQHLNAQQIYGGFDDKYALGHHWGMHIDLNACVGCGACTIACMSENNVPVVGRKEVSRHHEMTWLRIDRYYYGDVNNPNTVYQPMMCQHCDNAPCENVCPVNATNHSAEGLNQMAYNRCIGTRYCANNCPYKVRRFNWLDYTKADLWPINQPTLRNESTPFMADNLTRMVLNPDVTVRSRGVIEKCSFCVQRIQEGKLTAKIEGRSLLDGDVKTACQTACPTNAITFGDFNDHEGTLNKKLESPLTYIALEEINVRSSVNYTMKVNNRDEALDA